MKHGKELLIEKLDRVYQKQIALCWQEVGECETERSKLERQEKELQGQLQQVLISTIPVNARKYRREEYLCYVDWCGAFDFETWLDATEELEDMAREEAIDEPIDNGGSE